MGYVLCLYSLALAPTIWQFMFWYVHVVYISPIRSGVRLRSIGSGHTHLKLLISEQSSTRQRYKDLITTQCSASQRLDRWSQAEESPAIQDVMHQTHELNFMWSESQREFVGKGCLTCVFVYRLCPILIWGLLSSSFFVLCVTDIVTLLLLLL